MKITLCGKDGCCPSVEILENEIRIGEEGNLCVLKKEEWIELKLKILEGQI